MAGGRSLQLPEGRASAAPGIGGSSCHHDHSTWAHHLVASLQDVGLTISAKEEIQKLEMKIVPKHMVDSFRLSYGNSRAVLNFIVFLRKLRSLALGLELLRKAPSRRSI